jgi:TP901 family phage tail tape measure protein
MAFVIPSIFTAIDKFSGPLNRMTEKLSKFTNQGDEHNARMQRMSRKVSDVAFKTARTAAVVGTAILAPLGIVANEAIKFEDKMADVGKTTGLQGAALDKFGQDILGLGANTRTGVNDLVKIAEIGGQLGVVQNELLSFTEAANKFNVALGKDFSGGVEEATSQVGKIKALFADSRSLDISSVLNKTGSAINELGAIGAGTSANITDFTLRLGALPDNIKPSLTNTLALGTYLEELGIDAQIGAGGMTNFLLVAGERIGGFAKQMGLSAAEAKTLLAQDPTEFAKKFAVSFKGMAPEKMAQKLHDLRIGSQESIKVIGALSSSTSRLTELQGLSAEAFAKGTSLTDEYNRKNNTTAGRLDQAKNNLQAFTIVLGTQLLPLITDLLKDIVPVIKSFTNWAKQNPKTTATILKIAAGMGVLAFAVSGIAGVVGLVYKLNTALLVLSANPIILIIAAIIAGIILLSVLIYQMIKHWDEWGGVLAFLLGPLGLVISFIRSIYENWTRIKKAFTDGGILAGLKAIGFMLLETVLDPLIKILALIGKVPGMKWAKDAAEGMDKWMAGLRADVTYMDSPDASDVKPAMSTQTARDEKIWENIKTNNARVDINVNDPNGRTSTKSQDDFVHIKTTPTTGQFNNFSM